MEHRGQLRAVTAPGVLSLRLPGEVTGCEETLVQCSGSRLALSWKTLIQDLLNRLYFKLDNVSTESCSANEAANIALTRCII